MNLHVKMVLAGLVLVPGLCACTGKTSAIPSDPVAVNICQQPTAEMLEIPAMPAAPEADSPPGASSGTVNAYGEWCQLIRNKLNTIRQLYGKEPQ
ncbi:Uncharacterised protein [Klebsiella pneumoniae]|uniref:Lipoprotein n=1 Tax=Klebsiella pneumoniae TaxID=573 RepID=A0A2X3IWR0_KLEPN|nr:Uncharacterised protein [Klebsiella pneumoniae]